MIIQRLRYFVKAAETLSFTKTAKLFYISQSAITEQIKNLEEELDAELFDRSGKKLKLTPVGEVFLNEALNMIDAEENSLKKIKKLVLKQKGLLRIGLLFGLEFTLIPKRIRRFCLQNPEVCFSFKMGTNYEMMLSELKSNELDLFFSRQKSQYLVDECLMSKLVEEILPVFGVLVNPEHRFARRSSVAPEEIKYEKLIWQSVPGKYEERAMLMNFQRYGLEMERAIKAEDTSCMFAMLASGMGIGITTSMMGENISSLLNMIFVPLQGEMDKMNVMLHWKKDAANPAMKKFIEMM